NVFVGVFHQEYIENFTNNNKLLFCQLSKLLKSYATFYRKKHFLRILSVRNPNHTRFTEVVWLSYPKILREWWAIPGSNQ
uniref:hypothetical protein n=1 Tax=Vibrio fluvialis TaxID=676 RepID=UPI001E5F47A1